MTSITFGGGPTVQARRNFSNLKPGSQVPGLAYFLSKKKCSFNNLFDDLLILFPLYIFYNWNFKVMVATFIKLNIIMDILMEIKHIFF